MPLPRIACVSGCSSGLGRALVAQLAARGDLVYGGVRDPADGPRLPDGVRPLPVDVTRPDQVAAAIETIERNSGRLDLLISNAGAYAAGPWEVVPDDVLRRLFDVNFFGAVQLARAVLPLMRRQGGGRIVVVSSLSGLVGLPADGPYAASKFALEAFAESLSYEVRRWNIRVTIVNPGGYATQLMRRAWRPTTGVTGPYAPLLARLPAQAGSGSPEQAAAAIIAVADASDGPLRHSLDATGRGVFRVLGIDAQAEREALVRGASGFAWWIDGQAAPPDTDPAAG